MEPSLPDIFVVSTSLPNFCVRDFQSLCFSSLYRNLETPRRRS